VPVTHVNAKTFTLTTTIYNVTMPTPHQQHRNDMNPYMNITYTIPLHIRYHPPLSLSSHNTSLSYRTVPCCQPVHHIELICGNDITHISIGIDDNKTQNDNSLLLNVPVGNIDIIDTVRYSAIATSICGCLLICYIVVSDYQQRKDKEISTLKDK